MDFIKVASACPVTRVSDVEFNIKNILLALMMLYLIMQK